ncbi:hypothetical protein JW960_15750 [candidate division KSB1 bacterium]|nr:hypothetical protein [candidate division KSB1 bacterium]
MRQRRFIGYAVICIFIFGCVSSLKAQNLTAMLEALDKLESRLQIMEVTQKAEIEKLQKQLVEARSSINRPGSDKAIEALQAKTDALAADIELAHSQNEQLGSTATRLNYLAEKLQTLIETIESNQNVAAEPEQASDADGTPHHAMASMQVPLPTPQNAEPDVPGDEPNTTASGLEFSGFGDVVNNVRDGMQGEPGQIEIDLATDVADNVTVETAIAYDEGAFGLGVFMVEFNVFDAESHGASIAGLNTIGVTIGQFDVPFGIDYQVYASVDRKLISGPLVIENIHDYWNDVGIQVYAENSWMNGVAFITNGFGYDSEDESGEPIEIPMKSAVGGRFGYKPIEFIEVGSSYANLFDENHKTDMFLAGADLQLKVGKFSLKSEYIFKKWGLATNATLNCNGFYAQGMLDFGRYFFVSRYDAFKPDVAEDSNITRMCLGAGLALMVGVELRHEFQINNEGNPNAALLQLVVGF